MAEQGHGLGLECIQLIGCTWWLLDSLYLEGSYGRLRRWGTLAIRNTVSEMWKVG